MKKIKISNILFSTLFIVANLLSIFLVSSLFVNNYVLPKWYIIWGYTILICLLSCFLTKRIHQKIDSITICLFILCTYLYINNLHFSTYAISTVSRLSVFLLLFLFFKTQYIKDNVAFLAIVITSCLQALYGIMQYIGLIKINSIFLIIGSFDNPAGFAACLSVGFAFCFGLIGKKRRLNLVAGFSILIISTGIILSGSRAGIISVIIISGIFIYNRYKTKIPEKFTKWILSTCAIMFIVLFSLLYILKKDSASGRVLIWEATMSMIAKQPILGWGNDTFRSQYMLHQAEYFQKNQESKYELLADNVAHPFNEYLLLFVESGIIGIVLLFLLLGSIYKNRRGNFPFLLCVISVSVFACFSYPLRYPFVWLLLAYSLAKISNNASILFVDLTFTIKSIHKVVFCLLLLLFAYHIWKDFQFERTWNKIANLSLTGKTREILPEYEHLKSNWNGNPLFLYNYGAELNFIREYTLSNKVLHECEQYYNDIDVQMLLADNYYNIEDWDNAEKHYKIASNMCPNRFIPLYKLYQIYAHTKNNDEVLKLAHEILNKEVKIPSTTIISIKIKIKKELQILDK